MPVTVSTGVVELDALLGGGIVSGTSTLFMGSTGAGKSSAATRCTLAALERGELAAVFVFDEQRSTVRERSAGLGMDLLPHLESGRLRLHEMDAADLSPGKFAHDVRYAVEVDGARTILIDSLNGYYQAMPNEQDPGPATARPAQLPEPSRRGDAARPWTTWPDRCGA